MSRPPTSRGGHRRLNSIENDDWTETGDEEEEEKEKDPLLIVKSETKETKKKSRHVSYGPTVKASDDSSSISYR